MTSSCVVTAVGVTALLTALSACSEVAPASVGTSSSPTTGSSSPSPGASSSSPTGSAPAPAGFSLDDAVPPGRSTTGGKLGAAGIVRVGHHTDFDRVVWQFAGKGRPSYAVHYVDRPLAEGSGDRVDVRGEAYLQVDLSRVSIPDVDRSRPDDASDEDLAGTVVSDARAIYGGFEGYGQTWIGIQDQRRPFRVTVLTNPTRMVVDVYSG